MPVTPHGQHASADPAPILDRWLDSLRWATRGKICTSRRCLTIPLNYLVSWCFAPTPTNPRASTGYPAGLFPCPRGGEEMPRLHEMDPKRGRGGREWRRICASILVPGVCCAWCEGEIDVTLPATSRWSGTVDHITKLEDGGHPTARWNLQPMHRRCNTIKENKHRARQRRQARQESSIRPISGLDIM